MNPDNRQPKAVVEITLADVYNLLLDVRDSTNSLTGSSATQGVTLLDHETRIRSLEKRVWAIPSAATVISLLAVVAAYYVH